MTPETPPASKGAGSRRFPILAQALFVVGCIMALAMIAGYRAFSWDEFEFVRATDFVRQGLVPYRDFWEHHTPLQWFLMAPLKALFRWPGTATMIGMRASQIPAWVGVFWLLNHLMARKGLNVASRWAAMACLLLSPIFLLYAVEYRQETLSSLFSLWALCLLEAPEVSPGRARWAGAFLALVPLINMRFGPWVVVVVALYAFVDREGSRWRWQGRRAQNMLLGAATVTLVSLLYLFITGSLQAFLDYCFRQNGLGNAINRTSPLAPSTPYLGTLWTLIERPDPGALALLAAVLAQWARWCRHPARCTVFDRFALLIVLQLGIMVQASSHFNYHVQLPIILATPVLAAGVMELTERWGTRFQGQLATMLLVGLAMDYGSLYQWRSQHHTSLYMDQVMQASVRVTQPQEKVWDGVGYCLERPPYFKYWFLPYHIRLLSREGKAERLPMEKLALDPPGAIVYGGRIYAWVNQNPPMSAYFLSHFLPSLMNVWVPGLSGTLDAPQGELRWLVPRTGDYWLAASTALATHPWFKNGDSLIYFTGNPALVPQIDRQTAPALPAGLTFACQGAALVPDKGVLHLTQGSALSVRYAGQHPLGLFLVTDRVDAIFTPFLGSGDSFDAEARVMSFPELF